MNERLAILLLTAVANLTLGLAVWLQNSSRRANQYFAVFSFALATWTLSNGLVDAYAATPWGIIWARTAFAAASVIPLSFLFFVNVFPTTAPTPSKWIALLCTAAGLVAFLLSFTPLIARSTASSHGILHIKYGPLHPFFGAYFILCSAHSIFSLTRKLRLLKGVQRLQVRYVLLGVSLTCVGATVTNLLVPLLFQSSELSPYGPVLTLLIIAFTAHSIIRHRLMNIRLVIRRSVTYATTVVTAAAVFVFLAWLTSKFFVLHPRELPLWAQLTLVVLIALLFQPLKSLVQASTDRYFFREPYHYQHAIREISRGMGPILDLQSLLSYVCDAISRTVRPEFVAVYAADLAGGLFRRFVARGEISQIEGDSSLAASAPLPRALASQRRHILGDELRRANARPVTQAAAGDLRRLGGEFALPILEDEQLTGFFLLGPKLSGDPYFAEDIDLLTTLVSQASIAIKNAQLYSQVVLVNEYVENILATMENAVIAVSAEGLVTLFNSAAERLTRLDATQIKSKTVRALPASVAAPLEATLSDSQPRLQIETTVQDQAGRLTPVICSTSPLRDRTGTTLGAVAVFSDLTRLKTLEEEKRLAERFASIGALASGIAHEIKNPLVAIKTFAELLPERFTEEDFRNDFAQVVIREIDRIDDLVARLRGLASAPIQQRRPLDLRAPLEETLALLRGQLEQAQITVKTAYDNDLPLIAGDPAQLKQLFLNLLVNALEAMEPGGDLSVRIVNRKPSGSESLAVEITDNGTGIPEALLGKIFDPFVTTKQRGSGLGLSICRGIADAHGATIHAQNNQPGRGATICVTFPIVKTVPVVFETVYGSR